MARECWAGAGRSPPSSTKHGACPGALEAGRKRTGLWGLWRRRLVFMFCSWPSDVVFLSFSCLPLALFYFQTALDITAWCVSLPSSPVSWHHGDPLEKKPECAEVRARGISAPLATRRGGHEAPAQGKACSQEFRLQGAVGVSLCWRGAHWCRRLAGRQTRGLPARRRGETTSRWGGHHLAGPRWRGPARPSLARRIPPEGQT